MTQHPLADQRGNEALERADTETLQCRLNGVGGAGFLSLLLGAFFCIAPVFSKLHDRDTVLLMDLSVGFGALWIGLAAYSFLAQFRARIVADAQQLRWRGVGRWRSVYWEEIRDYYDQEREKGHSVSIVETEAGKLVIPQRGWTQVAELKARVQARAGRARARGWGLQHCRPEDDWPRLFIYDVDKNRRAMWGLTSLLAGLVLAPVGVCLIKSIETHWGPGWQWALAAFGLMELLLLLYALAFVSVVREYRDAMRRQHERITVDSEGLTFEDGTHRVRARWDEIRGWKIGAASGAMSLRGQYTVETETASFVFTRFLQDAHILRQVITLHLGRQPERIEDNDALDLPHRADGGRRLYTYRTRTNRALLLFPFSFAAMSLLTLFLPRDLVPEHPQTSADLLTHGAVIVGLWIGALVSAALYRIPHIEIDSEGITQRRLFGSRRLDWQDVQSYGVHKDSFSGYGEVIGTRHRIRFGMSIARLEPLKAEIARRAVRSRNREWIDAEAPQTEAGRLRP